MTPQELKNSILQLAIQGKLVEQRPEEGTAEELFARIQEEKQRLIKAGKIKKEKPLPEITEDEKPFEIPESWMWVRLGNVSTYNQRKEKISANDITGDMWSLDLEDIEKESGKIINICKASERKISGDKVKFHKGQILYSKLRPYLKKILVATDDGICSSEIVPFNLYGNIDSQYAVYFLKSPHVDFIINSVTYGVKMPRVGTDTMIELLFPLPPLAEQKRIVAKIEELLPYIDRYEQAWSKLEQFNSRFPDDMKKSLLQYAIQGKLVEQRPEEGTAEELFTQIQKEKQRLIAEKKIKKEKSLPEITDNEKDFEIPESWKWVRLRDIISILGDGIHGTPQFDATGEYFFINGNNLVKGEIIIKSDTKKVSHEEFEKHKKPLNENTILISINGTIGNYAFYNNEPVILGKSACYFSLMSGVDKEYICQLLNTQHFFDYAVKTATQTTIKNVSLKSMRMLPVPLPPLAEQRRIVEKLEQLLPLCERLK